MLTTEIVVVVIVVIEMDTIYTVVYITRMSETLNQHPRTPICVAIFELVRIWTIGRCRGTQ